MEHVTESPGATLQVADGASEDESGKTTLDKNPTTDSQADGSSILLHEYRRNARESVRVQINEFKGRRFAAIRYWYSDNEGVLKPGRNGVTIPAHELGSVAKALLRAAELLGTSEPQSG